MHLCDESEPSGDTLKLEKTVLRRNMRATRLALDEPTRARASQTICARLMALPEIRNAGAVAVYLAAGSEANIDALAVQLLQQGKTVAAPVLSPPSFARLHGVEQIAVASNGLRQPLRHSAQDVVAAAALEVILLPGLAFSRSGARLGQGVGWYDRVLASAPRAVTIGVCFDCQLLQDIPVEAHDRRASVVVTETQVIRVP
jgi:5-formyltetrahydrofolate cyclo-ligase